MCRQKNTSVFVCIKLNAQCVREIMLVNIHIRVCACMCVCALMYMRMIVYASLNVCKH